MIRNLNQLNFKGFGTVSPERPDRGENAPGGQRITLKQGDVPIFRAKGEVWIQSVSSMTVLSVSTDGEEFQHFYLDKLICIQPGIYYCLYPFRQESAAAIVSAQIAPEDTGKVCQAADFSLEHRLWVTDLYTFFYHEKEKGFFFSGESHPMLELTYVDQGSLHSVADGQDILLEQGDLVVYGSNQWHMQYADMDVAPRYVTISFDAVGSGIPALLDKKFRIPEKAAIYMHQLLQEYGRMDAYSTDMILSQLTQLLLNILRNADAPASKVKTANALHSENEIIRRAQQYVSSHIREKLNVPVVAKMVDVSPSYLTALFHKNLQISPGEYIRRIKLQESKQMIREGNMNFTEIADALQYSTVHHFSRQFKEKFGITPTEYAKSVR